MLFFAFSLTEHLEKIPYLLSLFVPIIVFFLFGLYLARRKFKKDHKRLKQAIVENDNLAADLTRALAPEKDLSQALVANIEQQQQRWSTDYAALEQDLFTERCRVRDLRNEITQLQSKVDGAEVTSSGDAAVQIQALNEAKAALEQQLTELSDQCAQQEEQLVAWEQAHTHNEQVIRQLNEQVATLEARLDTELPPDEPATPTAEESSIDQDEALVVEQTSLDLDPGDTDQDLLTEDEQFGSLYQSRPGRIDDLKQLKGVGKVLEGRLHKLGVYTYRQIALWTDDHQAAYEKHLNLRGRIAKDQWCEQARKLHGETYQEQLDPVS